jgi:hypothetical protein
LRRLACVLTAADFPVSQDAATSTVHNRMHYTPNYVDAEQISYLTVFRTVSHLFVSAIDHKK